MCQAPKIPNGIDRRDIKTFQEAGSIAQKFVEIFGELEIEIPTGSYLEEAWLNTVELENQRLKKMAFNNTKDIRPVFRKVIALQDLVGRIVRAHKRGYTKRMLDHLRLLPGCKFAQNVRTITDENSNKVFELLIGLVCSEIGTDLRMDSPSRPKGNNPDVLITVDKRRWGLACKVMNGYNALTMFERIQEGIEQIQNSEADVGCVVINLKNVIDHDKFWPIIRYNNGEPIYGACGDYQEVIADLRELSAERHFRLEEENTRAEIKKILYGKKSIPGVMLFLQTVASATIDDQPAACSIGVLSVMEFGQIQSRDYKVLSSMNEVLHYRYKD